MELTVVLRVLRRLPALVHLTAVDFRVLLIVHSEVLVTFGVHERTNGLGTILVVYETVLVVIEIIKDLLEDIISHNKLPVIHEASELIGRDQAVSGSVDVSEACTECFPLSSNLP